MIATSLAVPPTPSQDHSLGDPCTQAPHLLCPPFRPLPGLIHTLSPASLPSQVVKEAATQEGLDPRDAPSPTQCLLGHLRGRSLPLIFVPFQGPKWTDKLPRHISEGAWGG